MSRPGLSPVGLLATAAVIVLGTSAAPAAAAKKKPSTNGTISGTVRGAIPSAKKGDASVRAANAATGAVVAVARPTSRGTFKLTLPPGGYALTATVVSAGGAVKSTTVAVSLTKRQHRTGVRLTPSKAKGARAAAAAARAATAVDSAAPSASAAQATPSASAASYTTESGKRVDNTTAFSIKPFTGGTGSWGTLRGGFPAVLMAATQGKPECASTLTENSSVLPFLRKEAKGGRSTYYSAGKLKRDLITPGVNVSGKVTPAKDGKTAKLVLTFTDGKTKKIFDTVTTTISKAAWKAESAQVAKVVAERLCRDPSRYSVALHVDGVFDFPTHTATGTIDSSLKAIATSEGTTWTGSGKYVWSNVAYKSKIGCTFDRIQPTDGGWAATITSKGNSTIDVNWALTATDQLKLTVADSYCPNLPVLPRTPGPSQINLTPTVFTFPTSGGTQKVGGGINADTIGLTDLAATIGITGLGPLGFVNTGTLTVAPVWKYTLPA
ncbi:MAG: hypothetical protein AAGC46_01540 [Solirubrobacteraceae bacterium]|nr:hypothetical protein [Patulibacter sp.]